MRNYDWLFQAAGLWKCVTRPLRSGRALLTLGSCALAFGCGGDPDSVRDDPIQTEASEVGQVSEAFSTQSNGLPILSSYNPSTAHATIYLDFRKGWYKNRQYGFNLDPATGQESDTAGDMDTFDATEQKAIYDAWRKVAMHFSAFNADVTTVLPKDFSTVAWVAFTNLNVKGEIAIGAGSTLNGFGSTDGKPHSTVGSTYVRGRASGIAHEIGHQFGCSHISEFDTSGMKTLAYAHPLDPLHGLLMGDDTSGDVKKWTNWHTEGSGPDNLPWARQDDVKTIASSIKAKVGGDGFRPDEGNNSADTATAVTFPSAFSPMMATGVIDHPNDVDIFSVTVNAGTYDILVGRDYPSHVDVDAALYQSLSGPILAAEQRSPAAEPFATGNDSHFTRWLAAGTYYLLVQGHGGYDDLGQYQVVVAPVLGGWSSKDVGVVGMPGFASSNTAGPITFSLVGSDLGIGGKNDQGFQFTSAKAQGNFFLTIHVTSFGGGDGDAAAGLMARETMESDSRYFAVSVSPDKTLVVSQRAAPGDSATKPATVAGVKVPVWLGLLRDGGRFTAYQSSDGSSWTTIGSSQAVAMSTTLHIGPWVSSGAHNMSSTGIFDNLGGLVTSPTYGTLPAPTMGNFTVNSTSVGITWSNPASSKMYRIERSQDAVDYDLIASTGINATSFTDTSVTGGGMYCYRVVTVDIVTQETSQPSAFKCAWTKPGPVKNLRALTYNTVGIPNTIASVTLDWLDASKENGYRVSRGDSSSGPWTTRFTLEANRTMVTDSSLKHDTTYWYRIESLDTNGDVSGTQITSVKTPPESTTVVALGPPTN
jgi:hypothetical protein